MKDNFFRRLTAILAAAFLGGACIAQADMSDSTPRVVYITPTGGTPRSDSPSEEGQVEPEVTLTPTVTPVTLTAGQDLSCVTGPDWKLYEWVIRIPEGETVALVARAVPEIPDYYVVRAEGGKECWAFGGSSTISGPVETLPVRETPPPPTVSFVVRNRVYIDLIEVYIRPAGDSSWGADRLTSPSIPTDDEAAISITAGYYDVRILDAFGEAMYEAYNRAIGADDTYRILEVATDVDFTIQNNLVFIVCRVEIMPSGGSWETLYDSAGGGGPIDPGGTRELTHRAGFFQSRITGCTVGTVVTNIYIYPGMATRPLL